MKAVAFVFARGGSKGFPGKNIYNFGGKPLIAWSIECAQSVTSIQNVIVSTDSEEIASISRSYGASVPFMRPSELASDESPEWLSWRHALSYLRDSDFGMPEVMISLPATAPLRSVLDVENCLKEYLKKRSDVVVTVTDSHRNPYFNMVRENGDGSVELVIQNSQISRRQDAPIVYDLTTVCYVANSEFVLSHNSIFEGRVGAVKVPRERSIDIDSIEDLKYAEFLINERNSIS
jgi:N-acylneuraminate cytidylyltransferase